MSSYIKNTKNPRTGQFEPAMWLDDYFGPHHYGVMWRGGSMIDPERVKLETNNDPVDATFDSFDTEGSEHSEQNLKQSQNTTSLPSSNQIDAVDEILNKYFINRNNGYPKYRADDRAKAKLNALLVGAVEKELADIDQQYKWHSIETYSGFKKYRARRLQDLKKQREAMG